MDYSKQVNQKMLQGGEPHPDRNAPFEYISETVGAFLKADEPVISVDPKKRKREGTSRTTAMNIGRKSSRGRYLTMTSPVKNWGKSLHRGFITSIPT
jgi:hypothetical protein